MRQTITWQDFPSYLRALRSRYHISQQQLADSLGCTRNYIWRLEHGERLPSGLFLQTLLSIYPTYDDAEILLVRAFQAMRMYHMDTIEGADVPG